MSKVLICDSSSTRASVIARTVAHGYPRADIATLSGEALRAALTGFFALTRAATEASGNEDALRQAGACFDCDILIIENDLSGLSNGRLWGQAENTIESIRAFSSANYIVLLNKNPTLDFDLKRMVGDADTSADLSLNTEHLSEPQLWQGLDATAPARFLPWYWPVIADAARRRRLQVDYVRERFNEPLLDTLGFPESAVLGLRALGMLSFCARSEESRNITFAHFFRHGDARSIPYRSGRTGLARLAAEHGGLYREAVARIIASDLDHWLRCEVFAGQLHTLDLPRLFMQMPFLLGSRVGDIRFWNRCLVRNREPYGIVGDLYYEELRRAHFGNDLWSDKPRFWSSLLSKSSVLRAALFHDMKGANNEWPDVVFCEDISRFAAYQGQRAFAAAYDLNPMGEWHIAGVNGKQYHPHAYFTSSSSTIAEAA